MSVDVSIVQCFSAVFNVSDGDNRFESESRTERGISYQTIPQSQTSERCQNVYSRRQTQMHTLWCLLFRNRGLKRSNLYLGRSFRHALYLTAFRGLGLSKYCTARRKQLSTTRYRDEWALKYTCRW